MRFCGSFKIGITLLILLQGRAFPASYPVNLAICTLNIADSAAVESYVEINNDGTLLFSGQMNEQGMIIAEVHTDVKTHPHHMTSRSATDSLTIIPIYQEG